MRKLYKVTYYNLEKNNFELTTVTAKNKKDAKEVAEYYANKNQIVENIEVTKNVDFKLNFKK